MAKSKKSKLDFKDQDAVTAEKEREEEEEEHGEFHVHVQIVEIREDGEEVSRRAATPEETDAFVETFDNWLGSNDRFGDFLGEVADDIGIVASKGNYAHVDFELTTSAHAEEAAAGGLTPEQQEAIGEAIAEIESTLQTWEYGIKNKEAKSEIKRLQNIRAVLETIGNEEALLERI